MSDCGDIQGVDRTIISFSLKPLCLDDEKIPFKTGFEPFDKKNKDSGTLIEYIEEDTCKNGEHCTWLLREKEDCRDGCQLLGLFRYRVVQDREEFIDALHSFNVGKRRLLRIGMEIYRHNAKIIYFSRIGVQERFQGMGIGKVLSKFFELLVNKMDETAIVYFKIRRDWMNYMGPTYKRIGKGDDPDWGKYRVSYKLFLK